MTEPPGPSFLGPEEEEAPRRTARTVSRARVQEGPSVSRWGLGLCHTEDACP